MDETMMVENFDTEGDLPEGFVEEADMPEEMTVEEVIETPETPDDTPTPEAKEPGYVQRRIAKALEKQKGEMEAAFEARQQQMQADFDAKLAPILEKMLDAEAKELVRNGEFKSIERAKEYLQLKQGITPTEPEPQPRNEKGQFAKSDPATDARISMLRHQADVIKAESNVDVIAEFKNNEEIKNKVISGEMDFYDVLREMQKPKKRPPAPMRTPNGAGGNVRNAFETMSDEEFARLEKQIDRGVRVTIRQ